MKRESPTSTDFEDSLIWVYLTGPIDEESDARRAAEHCARLANLGQTVKAATKDRHIAQYAADWSLPFWMVYSAFRN